MCGIVGYVGKNNAVDVLIDGLSKLEYRGYDSAGVSVFENDDIKTIKSKGRLKVLEDKIEAQGHPDTTCGIGHTRWATHGEPSDINSHPHGNDKISIVHNGIIENYIHLKSVLTEKGYNFVSETDTESVAKLLDYYYDGNPFETIKKVIADVKGSYALGIVFKDFPNKIFAVRKDSPLIVGVGKEENFIASDIPAILKYTRDYYQIEENEIVELTDKTVTISDLEGNVINKEMLTATWDVAAAEKDGYDHFMLKEIYEQPTAFASTVSPHVYKGLPDLGVEHLTDDVLKGFEKIHIVACGTAMHAGMVGKSVIEQLARVPVNIEIASEFRYCNPIIGKNDLVMVISQSGETADTLAALRLAKNQGIHTLAVVNVVGSSISREADSVIYTLAGPEISVASTKAYTVQMSIMYLLAIRLAYAKGTIDECKAKELVSQLESMEDVIKETLKLDNTCKELAQKVVSSENLFFIGRGLDYALSLEGSLKLKEISYIHSEAYAAGELKHGTISLITDDIPVIAIATQSKLFDKMMGNIKEVIARGANVLLICQSAENISSEIDSVLQIPKTDDFFAPIAGVVPLQLFAYHCAVARGCDVDKPRNLAKSVTVE